MYLLDTNVCVALIRGRPAEVRHKFDLVVRAGEKISVPAVVAFELWYGAAKSARPDVNSAFLRVFFSASVDLLSFDEQDAKVAGTLRAELEAGGDLIGAYDLLIAAQALRHQMTLVTANVREFGRVRGLQWEDWGKA